VKLIQKHIEIIKFPVLYISSQFGIHRVKNYVRLDFVNSYIIFSFHIFIREEFDFTSLLTMQCVVLCAFATQYNSYLYPRKDNTLCYWHQEQPDFCKKNTYYFAGKLAPPCERVQIHIHCIWMFIKEQSDP